MITVYPIPAFTDNYLWCLHNEQDAYVVDPGDAAPVEKYLTTNNLSLKGILITHHHMDHIGGVGKLLSQHPGIPVFGPVSNRIPHITAPRSEGRNAYLPELDIDLEIMEVPGHTNEHIAYYSKVGLFCGDTMFSAGCGRLFEGNARQMYNNFERYRALPENTKIYCTHEYTLANLDFALTVTPDSTQLKEYQSWAKAQRANNIPTLPSNIALEIKINPFMRTASADIKKSVEQHFQEEFDEPVAVFSGLRRWKDTF